MSLEVETFVPVRRGEAVAPRYCGEAMRATVDQFGHYIKLTLEEKDFRAAERGKGRQRGRPRKYKLPVPMTAEELRAYEESLLGNRKKLAEDVAADLNRLLLEKAKRRIESLRLYRPMPFQKAFHESMAKERIVWGSNQCLAGDVEIFDPVLGTKRRVDSIDGEFHVWSMNPATGGLEVKRACRPFVKGYGTLYRVLLSNGEEIRVTMEHRVLAASGAWVSIRDADEAALPLACVMSEFPGGTGARKESLFSPQDVRPQPESAIREALPIVRRLVEGKVSSWPEKWFLPGCHADPVHRECSLQSSEISCQSLAATFPWSNTDREDQSLQEGAYESCQHLPGYDACHLPSNVGIGLSTRRQDAPRYSCTSSGFQGGCHPSRRFRDEQLRLKEDDGQCAVPSKAGVLERSRLQRLDGQSFSGERSRRRHSDGPFSIDHAVRERQDLSFAGEAQDFSQAVPACWRQCEKALPVPEQTSCVSSIDQQAIQDRVCLPSSTPCVFVESVEPLGDGDIWDIEVESYHNYITASIVSHNSGKTTSTLVEIARAVTGQDPLNRYPKNDGICYIVGHDAKEVAGVIYRKLFRAGAFDIIRDEGTDEWRPFDVEKDKHRVLLKKPAPPLIPGRFIKSIAWELRRINLPALIIMHNGWEIHFFSSNSQPPHGSQIDLALFDEEIEGIDWYPEVAARLIARSGYFLWSATPEAGTAQLFDLHERAQKQANWIGSARITEEFFGLLANNEYLTERQKNEFGSKLSAHDYMVKVEGQFVQRRFEIFPEYVPTRFEVPYFEIPEDWTVYCSIDPGRQLCAALFCAIPPPAEGDFAYLYDELYIPNCSAEIFAQAMRHKVSHSIQAFIIDHQHSRKVEEGSGKLIEDFYSEALARHGISCVRTGTEFTWGVADPKGGIEACRGWLRNRPGGVGPKLRVIASKVPNFVWEIKRYWYKRGSKGEVLDEPMTRGNVHSMAAWRYLVQDVPEWVPPTKSKTRPSPLYKMAQKLMGRDGRKKETLQLGPGA